MPISCSEYWHINCTKIILINVLNLSAEVQLIPNNEKKIIMATHTKSKAVERGHIFFLYQPKPVSEAENQKIPAEGLEDVQNFWMILSPEYKPRYRLIRLGPKKLPDPKKEGKRFWGVVDKVTDRAKELMAGLQRESWEPEKDVHHIRPEARPAGDGVYAIVPHENHTHLLFSLGLPKEPGQVQQELNIPQEGNYLVYLKNPGEPTQPEEGQEQPGKPHYPDVLLEQFKGKRYLSAESPALWDFENTELLFSVDFKSLPEDFDLPELSQQNEANTNEIFRDLEMDKKENPVKPLFFGEWS